MKEKLYTLKEVNEIVKDAYLDCIKIAQTTKVVHGDHYATYMAPSNDADELVRAIRSGIKTLYYCPSSDKK